MSPWRTRRRNWVHGDELQRLLAELSALGEATGTYRFMPGIANVCPTLQSAHELMSETVWVTQYPVFRAELLDVHGAADGAPHRAEEVVPQRRAAVVAVDGHVDLGVGRDREQRRVDPLLGRRVLHEVAHPVGLARGVVLRVLLQHHVDLATGGRVVDGRQGALPPDEIQGYEDSQPYHYKEGNEQRRRPGCHGHRITTSLLNPRCAHLVRDHACAISSRTDSCRPVPTG